MSRKRISDDRGGRFKRLLGWTILLAIVFSAGLITGERLVRQKNLDPLVSVDEQVDRGEASDEDDAAGEEQNEEADSEDEERSFAFFEKLTRDDEASLSADRRDEEQADPNADKQPDEEAPAEAADHGKDAANEAGSEAAAGDESDGEAIDEEDVPEENSPEAKGDDEAARYTLQVAAHPDLEKARSQMKELRKMDLEPHVVSSSIPNKGEFYRVRIGKFESMEKAEKLQQELKKDHSLNTFPSPL